jgi:hypothetical protein
MVVTDYDLRRTYDYGSTRTSTAPQEHVIQTQSSLDIAKLCPVCATSHAQDAVDAEPGDVRGEHRSFLPELPEVLYHVPEQR